MKKRTYIVAAMAVAMAALVGCQKDFDPAVEVDQAANAAARPVLGSPALVLGAETRATTGSNGYDWKFEANDRVGAVLVDAVVEESAVAGLQNVYVKKNTKESDFWSYAEYVAGVTKKLSDNKEYAFTATYKDADLKQKNDGKEFYAITDDQIWTNYPYTTQDGSAFTTPATLVEGHYMFYAPYNAGNGTRGPLVAKLPAVQDVSKAGNQAVAAFYKGNDPVVLALNYLSSANTSSVSLPLGHIFAYPQFTIVNNYEGYLFDGENKSKTGTFLSTENEAKTYTMKIKQIEFYTGTNATDDIFAYERTITPSALEGVDDWAESDEYKTTETNEVAVAVAGSAFDFGKDVEDKVYFANGLAADQTKAEQRIIVTLDKELAYKASYTFQVVMPGADYTDAGLFARVLVEIDGVDYYIVTNEVASGVYDPEAKVIGMASTTGDYAGYATINKAGLTTVNDYQFADRHDRGSDEITLVRRQRYPAAEIKEDNTAKGFKGELLTIELVGGMGQVALAAATEETVVSNGIKDNAGLLAFLEDNAHRYADVEEVEDAEAVENPNTQFYLAPENTVIIDAEVIAALANELPEGSFTLMTNLPIAANVVVAQDADDHTYTFTAGKAKYKISYDSSVTFNTDATKLTAGINRVATGAELKMATGAANAVVFVDADVTLKNPAGINGIVVADAKTLTVNASADVAAWVTVGTGAVIDMDANSKGFTNALNDFSKGEVKNQALATVAGKVGKVSYSRNGFGTEAIPAATQINYVTINAASAGANLPVETETFAYVDNLTKVTIEFGANITTLESTAETVTLKDNIVAVKGSATWNTTDKITGTTVSYSKDATDFTLTAGGGVTFSKRQ